MKKNVNLQTMMYPAPAVVASAYDKEGKADACTLAFASMISHVPPSIIIGINHSAKRKTLEDIVERGEFVVGFPSMEHVTETDYLGLDSGHDVDKLERVGFTTTKAQKVNAPIINEFKVSLECRVTHMVDIGSHKQITGEIVNVQADEEILNDKDMILVEKLDPIIYDDVSYRYFSLGEEKAKAFNTGLKYRE
ncbi:flavin reductase family protein [Methanosphaera sp.]